jgi:hypothetical protein
MDKVYVLFTRTYPKEGNYIYLPNYQIHYSPVENLGPRDKVAELNADECVDTMRCTLSDDESYVNCQLVTVSNIGGKAAETITETFILEAEHG